MKTLAFAAALLAATPALADGPLCVHGHPAKRAPGITYGGLPSLRGHQRDHWVSLGLGGPDVATNVHYQLCYSFGPYGQCLTGPAADKDTEEWQLEHAMCRGEILPDAAAQQLRNHWPLDASHGYDKEGER